MERRRSNNPISFSKSWTPLTFTTINYNIGESWNPRNLEIQEGTNLKWSTETTPANENR